MMKLLSRRGRSSLRVLLAVDGGVRTDASVAGRSAGRAVLYGLGVARVVGVIARVVGAIARVMRTITGVVRMIARVVGRGGALVRSAGVGMAVSVVGVGSVAVVVVAVAVAIVGVGSVAVAVAIVGVRTIGAVVASVGPPLLGNGTRGRAHTSLVSLEDHSQRMGLSRIIIPSHSFTHLAASSWFSKVM